VTVRIDSKVIEDMETGGSKEETRRLRFILDTVGKAEWPAGRVPEDYAQLVRKHNDNVSKADSDSRLQWIDERIPPGRDVRCIVSVAMLTEGWDANTVTHIVGLRPFGSQLLCEQVVGRALRRRSYALNQETQMFAEETAQIFGVPFEVIPFKVSAAGTPLPQPEPHHIYSVPEKAEYEITFPVVTGYHEVGDMEVFVDWKQVSKVTVDPMQIPPEVELTSLTSLNGSLAAYGPGERPKASLSEWRRGWRDQQVAFRLAGQVCTYWQEDRGAEAIPAHSLFPKVVFAAKRFISEKLELKGNSRPCDILAVGKYVQAARDALCNAIKPKKIEGSDPVEVAVIPQGTAGRGSTLYVDFHTNKPIYPVKHCHLNAMVADTKTWEQSAAFSIDTHPGVKKWVKNDRLNFSISWRHQGLPKRYVPDFIVVTDTDKHVIVEIKGKEKDADSTDAKTKAAQRWVAAVNNLGNQGTWHYLLVTDPGRTGLMLDEFCAAKRDDPPFQLT